MREEVVEVIRETRNGGVAVVARPAVLEEVLGDSLAARLEGPGEDLEDREVDLVVPREAPEPLALRRAVPGKRTGS